MPDPTVERIGAPKAHPFTICIIANPALPNAKHQPDPPVADPIMKHENLFRIGVTYIDSVLFKTAAGQEEPALSDPDINQHVRLVSIYNKGAPTDDNRLIDYDPPRQAIVPRAEKVVPFVARFSVEADIIFVVTAGELYGRASSLPSRDDSSGLGRDFRLNGAVRKHSFFSSRPGMIAIHWSPDTLLPLHEFQHALGTEDVDFRIEDLDTDDGPAAINRLTRVNPIPQVFCTYEDRDFTSDTRPSPRAAQASWPWYYCERHDSDSLALMDVYRANLNPMASQNDTITRRFIRDRILTRVDR